MLLPIILYWRKLRAPLILWLGTRDKLDEFLLA